MILNEDYFKDLELTNEDIQSDDAFEDSSETSVETILRCQKLYTDMAYIPVCLPDNLYISYHPVVARRLKRALFNLFELYGIEHSDLIMKEQYSSDPKSQYIDNEGWYIPEYRKFDFGYTHLACQDPRIERDRQYGDYHECKLCVYFNMPELSRRHALRFTYSILQIFSRNDYKPFLRNGFVHINDITKDSCYYVIIVIPNKFRTEVSTYNTFIEKMDDEDDDIVHTQRESIMKFIRQYD